MPKRITLKNSADHNPLTDENCAGVTEDDTVNLVELAGTLLKRRKLIVRTVLIVMIAAAAVTLLITNVYRSYASILPTNSVDEMTKLKNMAGLGGAAESDENSSVLYPIILRSRTIQEAVLNKTYQFTHDNQQQDLTLKDYFGIGNPDRLRRALDEATVVQMDRNTGVISIGLETDYPGLSQQVLAEYLAQLEKYNRFTRRSRAADDAVYLNRQLDLTREELQAAEDRLERFRLVNLDWAGSTDPVTVKELGRLQREVEVKTQKYLYLTQEHESARLDAQKDIPIVRILDEPSLPIEKAGPFRSIIVLLSGAAAFFAVVFGIIITEAIRQKSHGPEKESLKILQDDLVEAFPGSTRVINRIQQVVVRKTSAVRD